MKTKRLAIILSILILLTILVVLGTAVFTVQQISVDWKTKPNVLTVADNNDIISSSKIKKHRSVFALKKQTYINNIEKAKSYIKVNSIEVKFPNKIIIHASEREAYFYLKVNGSDYAILDKDLKVLELTTDVNKYAKKFGIKPIELVLDATIIANLNVSSGDFLNVNYSNLLKTTTTYLGKLRYNSLRAKNTFKSMIIKNNNLYIYTNLGLNIYVDNIATNFEKKLLYGVSGYEQYKDSYSYGTILSYSNYTYFTNDDINEYPKDITK